MSRPAANLRLGRSLLFSAFLASCLLASAAFPGSPPSLRGAVSVLGVHLLRDGAVWTPHGVVSVAFVAPPAAQHGVFARAYEHYSSAELAAIKAWGADTVRFQVSQPGLDPQNPLYTESFLATVRGAVLAARKIGLNVIVSVQDESQSGETAPAPLPNAATRRVWNVLSPLFNGDLGILYEILNEPRLPATAANWVAWAESMNEAIRTIRASGARNVVIADGLLFAERLNGAPPLTDPAGEVAYAAHPYAHNAEGQREDAWERKFGAFAKTAPVIVTEWTTVPKFYCDADTPSSALAFVRSLHARGIGLTAFAFDFGANRFGSVVQDFRGTPSTYADGVQCGDPGFGPGVMVQDWYRTGVVPNSVR